MDNWIFVFIILVLSFSIAWISLKCKRYMNDLDLLQKSHIKLIEVTKSNDDFIKILQRELSTGVQEETGEENSEERKTSDLKVFIFVPIEEKSPRSLGDPEELYVLARSPDEACAYVDTDTWILSKAIGNKGIIVIKRRSVL